MSREAMKLALEALKQIDEAMPFPVAKLVIMEAEKALAQPEQHQFNPDWDAMAVMVEEQQRMAKRIAELEAQPEPVIDKSAAVRIATALGWEPKRTWVGLTDEDKQIAFDDTQEASGGFWEFADAIEAKLKEKNHG